MPVLRIYSETLPLDRVRERTVTSLLRRYDLALVLAVRPWELGALAEVARTITGEGVPLSVWPMLSDDAGRWASASNAGAFAALVDDVARTLEGNGASELFFDLEPPFGEAQRFVEGGTRTGDGRAVRAIASGAASFQRRARAGDVYLEAERTLASSVSRLRDAGIASAAAVWPLVALDPPRDGPWQRVLGTPVDALGVDRVSVMAYTTIFEGWSRGAVRRHHAQALLARASSRTASRWGASGGVSLGCVGTGAFEDEPVYANPRALAEDAAIARAEGIEDLTLFDLGGVLARAPAEAWLDALTEGSGATSFAVTASKRVAAARTLARAATWALGRRRPR